MDSRPVQVPRVLSQSTAYRPATITAIQETIQHYLTGKFATYVRLREIIKYVSSFAQTKQFVII